MLNHIWNYIISHKWSKDILRANLLFVLLIGLYNLLHFQLKPVSLHFFIRTFLLMNLCLIINMFLNAYYKMEDK